jgi:hypothetical protein
MDLGFNAIPLRSSCDGGVGKPISTIPIVKMKLDEIYTSLVKQIM